MSVYRNILSFNIGKNFINKTSTILDECYKYNTFIVIMQNLRISDTEHTKHFESDNNTLKAKPYIMPGYTLLINDNKEEEFSGYTAIAICNAQIDVEKVVRVKKGMNSGSFFGRVLNVNIPTKDDILNVICVYAPNFENENSSFFFDLKR
jgi:exonuclease III